MTKTTNYQLNQWEKTDRILMEDFNADNTKIEASLDSKVPMTVLHDITLTEDTNQLSFNTAEENWSQYSVILITYTPATAGSGSTVNVSAFSSDYHMDLGFSTPSRKENLAAFSTGTGMTMLLFSGRYTAAAQALTFTGQSFLFGYCSIGVGNTNYPLCFQGTMKRGAKIKVTGIL